MSSPDRACPSPNPVSGAGSVKILVVDDDLINQRIMASLIKRKGWNSEVAASGQECLQRLARDRFDLILLDIQMPEMDGFKTAELARRLETQQHNRPYTPIVALTAMRQDDTRQRCLAAGMDDHLTKPVNTEQLYAVIDRLLSRNGPAGETLAP